MNRTKSIPSILYSYGNQSIVLPYKTKIKMIFLVVANEKKIESVVRVMK